MLLVHFQADGPLRVTTDASDIAVGAVLKQKQNNQCFSLGFYERKLSSPESKYHVYDRELLALYSSVRHFRHYLEGSHFFVLIDHCR